jgi:hypothetical protein
MKRLAVLALVAVLAFVAIVIVAVVMHASADDKARVHSPKGPAGYGLVPATTPKNLRPNS